MDSPECAKGRALEVLGQRLALRSYARDHSAESSVVQVSCCFHAGESERVRRGEVEQQDLVDVGL